MIDPNEPNPFAAPIGEANAYAPYSANGGGLWRDGKTLVMHRDARLLPLCVRSGDPVNEQGITKKLSWHHPLIALSVFAGCLIYIILAVVLTKKATIEIPLCEDEKRKRTRAVGICIVFGLLSVLGFFGSIYLLAEYSTEAAGALGLLASLIIGVCALGYGNHRSRILRPTKITDSHLWLRGMHPTVLAELPVLPPVH